MLLASHQLPLPCLGQCGAVRSDRMRSMASVRMHLVEGEECRSHTVSRARQHEAHHPKALQQEDPVHLPQGGKAQVVVRRCCGSSPLQSRAQVREAQRQRRGVA